MRRTLPLAISIAVVLLAGCEKLDRNMYDNPAFRPQEDPVRIAPADSVPTKGRGTVPAPGSAGAASGSNLDDRGLHAARLGGPACPRAEAGPAGPASQTERIA